jgi:hypothetical protein
MFINAGNDSKEIIVTGDLNINFMKRTDHREIKHLLSLYGFKQLVQSAMRSTENSQSLIDVIMSNHAEYIMVTNVIPTSFSDHDMVGCVRKINHQKFKCVEVKGRNYKHYDSNSLCNKLTNSDWSNFYNANNVNTAWNLMKDILIKEIDSLAPVQSKRIRGKPSPWLTSEIKMAMNTRDRILRKYRKTKSNADFQAYKSLRNRVNSLVKNAKSQYHKSLLEQNANDPDKFWETIKQIYPNKPLNSMPAVFNDGTKSVTDLKEISNLFSAFFHDVIRVMKDKAFSIRDCVWGNATGLSEGSDCRFQFNLVTNTEIETCLRSLKRKKSSGLDNISPFVLKDCSRVIALPLSHLINLSIPQNGRPARLFQFIRKDA